MVDKFTKPPYGEKLVDKINEIIDDKQENLVSGTNIKTINNTSLLGSGNIDIQGGGTVDQTYDSTSTNAQSGVAIEGARFLQNTATGPYSLTINGVAGDAVAATNIGEVATADTSGTAIGYHAGAGTSASALGSNANANGSYSIQLGYGTNSTASTLSVGFNAASFVDRKNWQLLDGTTGLIPYQRIDSITDNNAGGQLKTWTGTKAQYDAIVTKDTNTLYNITDDTDVTLSLLELLFPVGAVYFGTMSSCPLQTLGVGTWQALPPDKVIQIAGTRGSVGDTLNESLPNITGTIQTGTNNPITVQGDGCFTNYQSGTCGEHGSTSITANYKEKFDASRSSSTYQDDAPVQQDAYLLNGWRRIS